MPPLRRAAVMLYVPDDEIRPVVESLVRRHGSVADAARAIESHGNTNPKTIYRALRRVLGHEEPNKRGVHPETASLICIAAGVEEPPRAYRQRIWRVSGYHPAGRGGGRAVLGPRKWGGHPNGLRGVPEMSTRTWYYTSRAHAERRKRALEEQGRFIEWAVTHATWRELR